jgi:hypothetical protein
MSMCFVCCLENRSRYSPRQGPIRARRSRTVCVSTLRFPSGAIAVSLEDVWTGPHEEGFESDVYIKWRIEGTDGLADGTIGWPDYPKGSPSTLRYSRRATNGKWVQPSWTTRWFPQAFKGGMEQLQYAVRPARSQNSALPTT